MGAIERAAPWALESGTRKLESIGFRSARELLERVLDPEAAERLLRDAIDRAGELPTEPRALFAFLRNELGESLIREVGPRIATVWLDVARLHLCEKPRSVYLVDTDTVARAGLVRALIREGIEVSFDEVGRFGAPHGAVVRRASSGWSVDGAAESPTDSVAVLVRRVRQTLGL